MTIKDIAVPSKTLKRDYNQGHASALLTVRDYGLQWTIDYYNVKAGYCNRFTSPGILSYWRGYGEALREQVKE